MLEMKNEIQSLRETEIGKGHVISEAEAKVLAAQVDADARKEIAEVEAAVKRCIAEVEAETAKRDRICNYITTGLQAGVQLFGTIASVLIFSAGIEYEKTGTYTSPFTKSIAQNAMRFRK